MRVTCCYTDLKPETLYRLRRFAPGCELVRVGRYATDPLSYWRAIAARWGAGGDLMLTEHDIGIHGQVVPQFEACPELWCVFPYRMHHCAVPGHVPLLDRGLGCVRFRAAAQALVTRDDWDRLYSGWCGHVEGPGGGGCCYHLDGKIAAGLEAAGLRRHVHSPPVCHFHF